MADMFHVSVSPHIRDKSSTRKIMIDVCIALVPTLAFGVWHFGINALFVILSSVLSCVVSEAVFELIIKKPITVFDFSAVVTGLILALNMPPNIAWWVPAVGGVFAIVIVKMLFGGIGQNIMNPALAARCFLLISFASRMTDFSVDGVSSATPLAVLKSGGSVDLLDAFLGFKTGCIGEVSILAILIGAAYLLIRKVISIRIPAVYILSTALFIFLFTLATTGMPTWQFMLGELLTGGLMAGAFFMATDYTTSPITKWGQVIYAVLIGFLTAVFRVLGSSAEGVSYAIIISNLFVPIIEKITVPKPFGVKKKEKKGA
ncbi:MAG TPA: RnfABCDGE type electron transport complex subunit D [Candidatus Eubacterium faecale]|uniref:Ion-translocating oxidoreductase complex subunit D n=1 Tax=Candidatus Eubacterium faecale TaxID=2838568 RepID=A0A9D2MI10_9FIRM|nr:RnfABCDGE type electron transport complex subunit D [Candidatus Eubacterium faecale]